MLFPKNKFWNSQKFSKKKKILKNRTVLRFRKSNISGSISKVSGNLSTLIRKNWTSKKHDSFTSWKRLTRNAIYTLQEREIVPTKLFRTYHRYRFSKCHLFSGNSYDTKILFISLILFFGIHQKKLHKFLGIFLHTPNIYVQWDGILLFLGEEIKRELWRQI